MTKPKDPYIDPMELISAVCYDPETGIFRRNKSTGRSPTGAVLGIPNAKGYLRFNVLGHANIRAHRLAWYYCYGRWPAGQIDHINGDPADNRIANLREVTNGQNQQWKARQHTNLFELRGVQRKRSGFIGCVEANGRRYRTRQFKTVEAAKLARDALARELHGEFARF